MYIASPAMYFSKSLIQKTDTIFVEISRQNRWIWGGFSRCSDTICVEVRTIHVEGNTIRVEVHTIRVEVPTIYVEVRTIHVEIRG